MQYQSLSLAISAALIVAACGSNNNTPVATVAPPSTPPPATTPAPADPPAATSAIASQYRGTWNAPGYGLSLVVSDNSANAYRYSSNYCWQTAQATDIDTADIERLLRSTENPAQLEWYTGFGSDTFSAPGIVFERVATIPSACQDSVFTADDIGNTGLDALEIFDIYSQIFSEYYLDFERNQVDWPMVTNNARASLNNNSSDLDLLDAMNDTLAPLADGHNFVQSPQGLSAQTLTKPTLIARLVEEFAAQNSLPFPIPQEVLTPSIAAEANAFITAHLENQWQLVADYAQDTSDIQTAANGLIRWFENQGLGYLYIGAMSGYAQNQDDELDFARASLNNLDAALDAALADLSQVSGLIIDVRTNDGGFDYISLAIASRFAQSEVHAYSKQARDGSGRTPLREVRISPRGTVTYDGPIALLTSSSTVSAAEVFTLSMRQLPQVTLIGEPSHGAFSDVMDWVLPNGFAVGLSNEYYLSPEGQWFEGTGIPVDIAVPFYSQEQRELEVDFAIEAAIAHFSG